MGNPPIEEAVASPGVEIFGVHELVLNPKSKSGYKDVYPVQRKKRPWQAKVWDESRRTHLCLGSFTSEKEAAVAVAVARAGGVENIPSPDKNRAARGSGGTPHICTAPPSHALAAHSSLSDSRLAQENESSRQRPSPPLWRLHSTPTSTRSRRCPWRCCFPSEPRSASKLLQPARLQHLHSQCPQHLHRHLGESWAHCRAEGGS